MFTPTLPSKVKNRNIKLEVAPDRYARLETMAAECGISLKELLRQFVDFGVAHYQPPTKPIERRSVGRPVEPKTYVPAPYMADLLADVYSGKILHVSQLENAQIDRFIDLAVHDLAKRWSNSDTPEGGIDALEQTDHIISFVQRNFQQDVLRRFITRLKERMVLDADLMPTYKGLIRELGLID